MTEALLIACIVTLAVQIARLSDKVQKLERDIASQRLNNELFCSRINKLTQAVFSHEEREEND